jgi:hypothetical protein
MTSSTSFSSNLWIAVCFVFAVLWICPQPVQASGKDPLVGGAALTIAVFPVENLTRKMLPLERIRTSLIEGFRVRGFSILGDETLEQFRDRHRLRYMEGVTAEIGHTLRDETGATAVLIPVIEAYEETFPPKIELMCRVVDIVNQPVILWMESVGMTGEDSLGLLQLGVVTDPHKMLNDAVERLADSFVSFRAGTRPRQERSGNEFKPKSFYRSAALGPDLREINVGFPLRVSWSEDTARLVKLYVALSSPSGHRVTVDYAVISGTVREGEKADYQLKGERLVFEPGETLKGIEIKIMNTRRYDSDKTMEVALSKPVNAVLGDTVVHTLVIANSNPLPSVAFGEPLLRVREDAGVVVVPVKLSAVSGKDVVVPFTVEGAVRTQARYKVATPSPLVIKAGSAGGTIAVEVLDNGLQEDDETVMLSLGVPTNAMLGIQTVSTLTVVDNDPAPVAAFVKTSSRGEEGMNPAKLEVSLNPGSGKTVTVEYAVTGGTARNGIEYALKGGTLVFKPGETRKTVDLEVRPSTVYKDDKTVEVTLSKPKNAVLGEAKTHVYTVVNTVLPPTVTFGEPAKTARENEGLVRVPVKLSAVSGKDVVVPFTVEGSAKAGGKSDERLVTPSPLVIRAGRSYEDIVLLIEDNRLHEDDKTIVLTLGNPTNAVPGMHLKCSITVRDNNARPTVAVTPFFNDSTRNDAGEIVTLHFIKSLLAVGRFSVIDPGEVRKNYLTMRMILKEGMNLEKADLIANFMETDLLFTGRVASFLDSYGSGGVPAVDFSVIVIERTSKKVIWSSRSYQDGNENVIMFEWGKVRSADVLASRMSRTVVNMLVQ